MANLIALYLSSGSLFSRKVQPLSCLPPSGVPGPASVFAVPCIWNTRFLHLCAGPTHLAKLALFTCWEHELPVSLPDSLAVVLFLVAHLTPTFALRELLSSRCVQGGAPSIAEDSKTSSPLQLTKYVPCVRCCVLCLHHLSSSQEPLEGSGFSPFL